jgi:hypothetical protein
VYKQQQQEQEQEQQDAENPFLDPPFSRIKTVLSRFRATIFCFVKKWSPEILQNSI